MAFILSLIKGKICCASFAYKKLMIAQAEDTHRYRQEFRRQQVDCASNMLLPPRDPYRY